MKYAILTDSDHSRLTEDVNRFIRDGWVPQGGVAMHTADATMGGIVYAQAIVLRTDPTVPQKEVESDE